MKAGTWSAVLIAGLATGWFGPTGEAAEPLTPARFDELHQLMQPTEEESVWLQIPWQTDLSEARRLAAAEGKPLLLWQMDGNPLGCG